MAQSPSIISNWKQFGIGAGVTAILYGLGILGGLLFLNSKAQEWGQNLRYYSELYPKTESQTAENSQNSGVKKTQSNLDIYLQKFKNCPESEKLRIKKQMETIRFRAKTHLRATKDFYIWSSVVSGISLLASVISASCLLHITRRGWDDSSSVVLGIFVTSFATFAFSSSCILLYEYEKNTSNNATLYIYYINLEDDVLTALATRSSLTSSSSESTEETTPVTLKAIILDVQEKLKNSHTLDIEFDFERDFKIEDFLEQSGVK